MKTLGTRIEVALKEAGGVAAFEQAKGVRRTTTYGWIKDTSEPRASDLLKISSFSGRSVQWILSGVEADTNTALSSEFAIEIPMFDVRAAAGSGALVQVDEPESQLMVSRAWINRYGIEASTVQALESRGDSMLPYIADGDMILITTDFSVQELLLGGIFVFTDQTGLRVKRIEGLTNGDIRISSDNIPNRDEILTREAFERDIMIHGRVFWSGGALRGR